MHQHIKFALYAPADHHMQGFVRRRALRRNSSHRDCAQPFGKCAFSYAGPAAWNPLHGVEPTSCRHPVYNRLSHRHLKRCSNLILVANTFCSTVYLYVVRRLCSASNRRPTKSMMMMNDDDKPGGRLSYFPPGPRLPPSRRASPIGWYRLYLSRCIIISYRSYKVQHCCVRS